MSDIEEEIRKQMLAEQMARSSSQAPSFDLGPQYSTQPPPSQTPPQHPKTSKLQDAKNRGGIVGWLATIALVIGKAGAPVIAVLSKLKFLAIFGKFFLTFGSMFLSIWLQAQLFGWPLAAGIVILIFVHECGHALAAIKLGHKVTRMIFIPFMGAAVWSTAGKNVIEDAFVGIMGPVFGTLGGIVCLGIYFVTGSPFWVVLAKFNFMINLFNLLPTAPLDGGWITPVFSGKLLAIGSVLLLLVGFRNPFIWILAFVSIPRIISGWKADPTNPYYITTPRQKIIYALAYFGLAATLGLLFLYVNSLLDTVLSLRYTPVA